ncbi:hypothetical protein C4J81_02460 [Deltaproteobacteria bacterium Smac51]|nr:hypothetical protein C4J81_02460 [Deltaproteobacteria bacterium Smac51]
MTGAGFPNPLSNNEWPPDRRLVRRLARLGGRAVVRYRLIADGDVIVTAVSGGKDSLVMTKFLADLRLRAPVKYRIGAVHLGPGGEGALRPWLEALNLDFIHWEAAPVVPELADYRPGGPSPCFNCARLRRNRLFELCRQYGANRLALGHHLDDAAETFLMNALHSGRIDGLSPRQELFAGKLSIIRPLLLTPEGLIKALVDWWGLPVMKSGCPADGHTVRQEIKELVAAMAVRHPKIPGNLSAVVEAAAEMTLAPERPRYRKDF